MVPHSTVHLEALLKRIQESGDILASGHAALRCADAHAASGSAAREWHFLRVACEALVLCGAFTAALSTSARMVASAYTEADDVALGRSLTLQAVALRCKRHFEPATEAGRRAVQLLDNAGAHPEYQAEAVQALISALADAGAMSEAWQYHARLAALLDGLLDENKAGKGFWTLGNLAFLAGHGETGAAYHARAGALLSPANDVHQWARFNKSSADLQLQAGIANQQTQDCIERAVLAYRSFEPGPSARLGLTVTYARWLHAVGRSGEALATLEDGAVANSTLEPAELVPAYSLWADVLESLHRPQEAEHFRNRALQYELISREEEH
ncbi:hypothetical protein ACQ3I4_12445 [Zafaria sp. Z1313]|uniref:hypothetical protein n=1 Tax=Zafaria sp. Z1313 TaxID=3423202 RepID=UPI003D302D60